MNDQEIKLIVGGIHTDKRGRLEFFNNFDMSLVKRIYFIKHFNVNVIRAWQGHKIESRWFKCIKGEFKIKLVKNKQVSLCLNFHIL